MVSRSQVESPPPNAALVNCFPLMMTVITCGGSWGEDEVTFGVQDAEGVTARVDPPGHDGRYTISIAPNQDVLFYLGLVVCIDQMHFENDKKK